MELRRPWYDLSLVKSLIKNPGSRIITQSSLIGAAKIGLSYDDIIDCIYCLSRSDFYKSMTSHKNHKIWQDVYRPIFRGFNLYVKVQISHDKRCVVISFKER
jgi:motility quorum-sensing regulator/GCU-specific mRNA interferase toxin